MPTSTDFNRIQEMPSEKRRIIRLWIIYLALSLILAGFMFVVPEKQLAKLNDFPVASWLTAKQTEAANRNSDLPSASLKYLKDPNHWLSSWLENDEWLAGVNRYMEMAVISQEAIWNAPPAGRSAPSDIIKLQNDTMAKASLRNYHSIEAELYASLPASEEWNYILKMEAQGHQTKMQVPGGHGIIDLLDPGKGQISLQLIQKSKHFCFFSCSQPFTGVATLPLADLSLNNAKDIVLPQIESDKSSDYHVRIVAKSSDIERLSGDDADPSRPKLIKIDNRQITKFEGDVSFNGLDASDYLLLSRSDRYTAVLVMGDGDLRNRVWIESDKAPSQRIGNYHPQVPLLVAVTNAWSSLRLNIRTYLPNETLKYRVLAMSGKNVPGKELIIEAIGKYLTDLEIDRRPISGPELNASEDWLVTSLGVRFTDEDIDEMAPPQVQALIKHLVEITHHVAVPNSTDTDEMTP